jgi:serine/threonine-protein kinase
MFLQTPYDEHSGEQSPDGGWLVYASNESGQEEVYVRPFPGSGGRMRVSTEGGREPVWSRDGREIFYRNGEKMMAVAVSMGPEFRLGRPVLLFEGRYRTNRTHRQYDVAADGQHFLMTRAHEESEPAQIYVVLNWLEELKRLVPTE